MVKTLALILRETGSHWSSDLRNNQVYLALEQDHFGFSVGLDHREASMKAARSGIMEETVVVWPE